MNKKGEEGKRELLYLEVRKKKRKEMRSEKGAQAHLITHQFVCSFVHHHIRKKNL
jgi:hypothetical protein